MDTSLLPTTNNREQAPVLERQYPRVFSKIMELWDSPDIDAYFMDIMINDRHDRQGFPPEVAAEIMRLSMTHARQRDRGEADPWGCVSEKIKNGIELQGLPFSQVGLIKAAESGKCEAIALFLSAGMEVDTCDERQWTPLMISSFNGNEEMADLLINSGANIHHSDTAGYTPLHWAAFNGFTQVVRLLISKRADVNARSVHGWTALLQAATRGHLSVGSILIEHGADVNAASNDGWTPLHKAAANGHFPDVMLLLRKGADASAKYANGVTPLDLAIKNKHEQIVAMLSGQR